MVLPRVDLVLSREGGWLLASRTFCLAGLKYRSTVYCRGLQVGGDSPSKVGTGRLVVFVTMHLYFKLQAGDRGRKFGEKKNLTLFFHLLQECTDGMLWSLH